MDECGASEAKTSYRCNLLRETGEMPLVGPSVSRKLNRDLQANYLHPPATGAPRPLPRTLSFLICSPIPLFSKKVLAGMARVQNAEDLTMPSWPDKISLLRRRWWRRALVCVVLRVQKSPMFGAVFDASRATRSARCLSAFVRSRVQRPLSR